MMLRLLYHTSPDEKKAFFKTVKNSEDVWLVSHVEAKNSIQAEFLTGQNILATRSVQRAKEYWAWLLTVNAPEWNIVSDSLIYTWLEEWFESEDLEARYRDVKLFYNFFGQFLPVISGEQRDLFVEWLEADPARNERLGGWLAWGEKFWDVLNEKKSLPRDWVLSALLQLDKIEFGTAQKFYIDLGADLQQLEVEMIMKLSEEREVNVLVPAPPWREGYEGLFGGYKKFLDMRPEEKTLPSVDFSHQPLVASFPSIAREVKVAVAQVRQWLDQGVLAKNIGVVSPKIEDYWDVVREHLIVEGVAIGKKLVSKPIAFPYVQSWLSRLRLLRKDFTQPDLENFLFGEHAPTESLLNYRDFKKNYSFLYEADSVRDKLPLPHALKSSSLSLLDFTDILYKEWPSENKTMIDRWSDKFIQDVGLTHKFSFDLWLKYLEFIISMDEVALVAADENGVWVGNLSQSDWSSVTHAVVLGCTQSHLRESLKSPAQAVDIFALENDLGLVLQRVDQNKNEFDLRWFLAKNLQTSTLLRSHTNFEGEPQTASSYILSLAQEQVSVSSLSESTRWDELMKSSFEDQAQELQVPESERPVLEQKLAQEIQAELFPPVHIQREISVSSSSFEKIFNCGFKFYADKVLKLPEPRLYDLDIDVMYQGNLFHAILEELGRKEGNLDISEQEFAEIYDRAVESLKRDAPAHSFWLFEKDKHYQLIRDFIEMEKAWRMQFPRTKILGTEVPFKGHIGVVGDDVLLSKDKEHPDQVPLSGKIDRVDRDVHGQLSVTDYKTGSNNLSAIKSWVKNGKFQMPLYAMSLEKGLAEGLDPAPVSAAYYLMLKQQERGMGYVLTDVEHELGESSSKKHQNISHQEREQIFSEMRLLMKSCLEKIRRGEFPPIPKDFDVCKTCNWSLVCRAPHLR